MLNQNQLINTNFMKKYIVIISVLMLLTGCKWLETQHTGDIVAQVNDKVLYENDIRQLVPIGTSPEDSIRIVYQYIQQWATNQLLYQKAVQNSDKKDEIETMVQDYRRLLYVHEYEQNLLQRRISDTIPDDSVRAYYNAHREIFRLKDNIVKGIFIIIPQSSKDASRLIEWMRNPTQENLRKIDLFAYEKSLGYNNFVENWQNFNEIKLRMPLQTVDDTEWLRQNSFIILEDTAKTYLLRLTDKLFIDDKMPFEIAKPEIINVMENGLQISTLRRIEQELYYDGVRRGDIYLKETRSLDKLLSELPEESSVPVESQQTLQVKEQRPAQQSQTTPKPAARTDKTPAPAPTPQQQFQETVKPQQSSQTPAQSPAQSQQQPAQPQQQQEATFDYDIFD